MLATNVAETSLTVPNIGYVIDTGLARVAATVTAPNYSDCPLSPSARPVPIKEQGVVVELRPACAIDFLMRVIFKPDQNLPMPKLGGSIWPRSFYKCRPSDLGTFIASPFIDPPEHKAIKDAVRLLEELHAIEAGKLTSLGRRMARMPVDPRWLRCCWHLTTRAVSPRCLSLFSALSVQDVRERPIEKAQRQIRHEMFVDEQSDFLTYLNLWRWIEQQRSELTNSRWQTALRKRFINPIRVREWREIYRQLKSVCTDLGLKSNSTPGNFQQIHESILAGSLSQIGRHEEQELTLLHAINA